MEYHTLHEQLQALLRKTNLLQSEQELLLNCYLSATPEDCCFDEEKDPALATLSQKGMIISSTDGQYYPLPISLLFHEYGKFASPEDWKRQSEDLELWLQYPAMRSEKTRFKSAEKVLAKQWIFEILKGDWERVYCFGDYEGFIEVFGKDEEQDWIRNRMKMGKRASVLATQDGEWAQHIHKKSTEELRDCSILPSSFKDMFIMSFPEMNTTIMTKLNGDSTFVHSKSIANSYSSMVQGHVRG